MINFQIRKFFIAVLIVGVLFFSSMSSAYEEWELKQTLSSLFQTYSLNAIRSSSVNCGRPESGMAVNPAAVAPLPLV